MRPMPLRRPLRRLPLFALLVSSAACGGSGDGPAAPTVQPPSVRVVAGDGVTDTVMSAPVQALVVEVRDSLGKPVRGALVRFSALPSDPPRMYGVAMYVCPLTQPVCGVDGPFGYGGGLSTFAVDSSNESGHASALVRLGSIAGPAKVLVTVPELGIQDTARFTVLAGAPARVVATVRDTAIFVDRSYPVRAAVTDRYGNPRGEAVAYTSDPLVSVSSTGTVRGVTVGRGRVIASAGTGADTVMVSVVPMGHLAAYRTYGPNPAALVEFDLDGSNYKVRAALSGQSPALTSWLANGDVLYQDAQGGNGTRLFHATPAGVATRLVPDEATTTQYSAQPARAGEYVYFFGSDANGSGIFRVRNDGTGVEPLVAARGGAQPAPSPDGTRVAFVRFNQLFVLDVATGVATSLQQFGSFPRWSPTGNRIAYLSSDYGGAIVVVNADGTGARTVSGFSYSIWIDWSPDGEWIVAGRDGRLVLVRASSGEELPLRLPVPDSHFQPSWRY